MTEHPLDYQLKDGKIIEHLDSIVNNLHHMLKSLLSAYHHYYKRDDTNGNFVRHSIWEIIKTDPNITKFFILQQQYLPELNQTYESTVAAKRIVEIIIEKIKSQYPDDFI